MEPPARLERQWLVGDAVQNDAGFMSESVHMLHRVVRATRLPSITLYISTPSSTKMVCPRTLYTELPTALK